MPRVDELDLVYLPVEAAEFAVDPFPQLAAARKRHPWLARCSFGYLVNEYQAMRDLMGHEDKMRMGHAGIVEFMGAEGTPWGRFLVESIQAQGGEAHRRLRDILAPAFTPKRANLQRDLMREVVSRLLEEWAPKGAFDFEAFATLAPITMTCRMIGAPLEVIADLRSSLETLPLGFSMDRQHLPALQASVLKLDAFARGHIAQRRARGAPADPPDLLDHLLEASDRGGMSDDELANLLIFLFVAGYDTSKNVLTLVMHVLLDRPEDYARCGQDPAFCRRVVDETLRFHGPASSPRIVSEAFEYRGVLLPKDTMLFFPWSTAGRDATAVGDPDVFDPERPSGSRHLAFGLGPHICIGQFIARAQIEESLHLIAQRVGNPKRAGQGAWRPFPGVWGIRGLPITFEPAPAPAAA